MTGKLFDIPGCVLVEPLSSSRDKQLEWLMFDARMPRNSRLYNDVKQCSIHIIVIDMVKLATQRTIVLA